MNKYKARDKHKKYPKRENKLSRMMEQGFQELWALQELWTIQIRQKG